MATEYRTLLYHRKFSCKYSVKGVKVINQTNNVYKYELKKALDHYYLERLLEEGECTLCKANTSKFCSSCGTHYCSVDCQSSDWARHQTICEKVLSSSQSCSTFEPDSSSNEESSDIDCKEKCTSPKEVQVLDKRVAEVPKRNKSDTDEACKQNRETVKNHSHGSSNGSQCDNSSKGRESSVSDDMKNNHIGENDDWNNTETTDIIWNSTNYKESLKDGPLTSNTIDLKLYEGKCRFTIGQTLKVTISSRERHGIVWVIPEEKMMLFKSIKETLAKNCGSYKKADRLDGGIYGIRYNKEWYRGKILRSSNKSLIRCVDIGQLFSLKFALVKALPPELRSIEPMAFPVEFVNPVPEGGDMTTFISIEIVDYTANGVYIARMCCEKEVSDWDISDNSIELKNGEVSQNHNCGMMSRCSVDDLEAGHMGVFVSMQVQNGTSYGCFVPENIEEAVHCYEKIGGLYCMEADKIDAKVGDFIMVADNDMSGQRGVVISKSEQYGYKVRLVDHGYFIKTKKVFKLPENTADLIHLACKMTVEKENFGKPFKFETNTPYFFDVEKNMSGGKWLCALKNEVDSENVVARVVVEKAENLEQNEVYIPMESGCDVIISAFSSEKGSICVRRIDRYWEKVLETLNLRVNTWIKQFGKNVSNVQVGDIVGAKYEQDNLWYRAKVISKDDGKVKVVFIDFGNVQMSDETELMSLPNDVKSEAFFAREVTFRNGKKSFSKKGKDYLLNNILDTRELIMTYEGDISNGVVLRDKQDGLELNRLVFDDELSASTDHLEVSDSAAEQFLQSVSFKQFPVKSIIVLYIDEEEFTENGIFWAADPFSNCLKCILEELGPEISIHCNSSSAGYSPLVGELCLALYEDDWYRGHVVEEVEEGFQIFFVDFGNTALTKPQCIRKMVPKFIQIPPVAIKCYWKGFDNMNMNQRHSAYNYLLNKINESVNSITVEKCSDFYNVNFTQFSNSDSYNFDR